MSKSVVIAMHVVAYVSVYSLASAATLETASVAVILIWISSHDLETREIPDTASVLLFLMALALSLQHRDRFDLWLGGILFPSILWAVSFLYRRSRGHEGLGFGDVKLSVGLGLLVGLSGLPLVLLAASCSGALTMLALRAFLEDKSSDDALAFAPFLCLSTWTIWLNGYGS